MKNMLIILLVASGLLGCGLVTNKDIQWAESVCANNGGVEYIVDAWLKPQQVRCNNKALFTQGDDETVFINKMKEVK